MGSMRGATGSPVFPSLPFSLRAALAAACFVEAAILIYVLAISFPLEAHIQYSTYITATLASAVLMEQALLRRAGAPSKEDRRKLMWALERLKQATGLGHELRLVWMPKPGRLAGEVKNNTIYIYDEDYRSALETLVEEFVEYHMFKASLPYLKVLNALLKTINEEAYRERDTIAKALSKILLEHVLKNIA